MSREWRKIEHQGEWYITCEELVSRLFEYLDADASEERIAEFEKHLAVCPPCVTYLETYRQAAAAGRAALDPAAAEEKVPIELAEDLVRAILAARKG